MKKILFLFMISTNCFWSSAQISENKNPHIGDNYFNVGIVRLEYFHALSDDYHLLIGGQPLAIEFTPFYIKRHGFSSFEDRGKPILYGDFWIGLSQQKSFGRLDYFLTYTIVANSSFFNNGGEIYPPYEDFYNTYNANADHLFGIGFQYSYHVFKWLTLSHGVKFKLSYSGLNKYQENTQLRPYVHEQYHAAIGFLSLDLLSLSFEF